ncbi:MAG: MerR family transcriptional regulator [Streptosporangiales bacterium]|nr:MerR family transcriptional regulator [Streptosporangiales bacterium]
MLISELSRRSGVPIATIKYYLREGLLPPGEATAATRAEYDDLHLGRLRLIRALVEVGNLPLAAIRRILGAVDNEDLDVHGLLGTAQYALGPKVDPPEDEEWQETSDQVDAFLADLGWRVTSFAPARKMLTQALVTLRRLGMPAGADQLRPYAGAAETLAREEIGRIDTSAPRSALVEGVVVGTVLYEPVLIALCRLAQEHQSALRFAPPRS